MEFKRNYSLQIENFKESYLLENKNFYSSFLFKTNVIKYNLRNNNYTIEIKNKTVNNPFSVYRFIPFRFLNCFSASEIHPLKLSFYKQKLIFSSKENEKIDFIQTTVFEANIFSDIVNFYLSYPKFSDIKKFKLIINILLEKKLKLINELPKNLPIVFGFGNAGIIFHEIVSHPLEGDVFKNCYYKNKIGSKVSKDFLNIIDDPTYKGLPLTRKFDDEGEECSKKVLIEGGVLKNILCNNILSKALLFPAGNGRITDGNPIPLPRSWNTIVKGVKGNKNSYKEIYTNFLFVPFIKKASFLPPDKVSILAGPAFYYINRKVFGKTKYLIIEGNIKDFLSGIDFIGENVENCINFGACTKNGGKLFVGAASPIVSFTNISYKI